MQIYTTKPAGIGSETTLHSPHPFSVSSVFGAEEGGGGGRGAGQGPGAGGLTAHKFKHIMICENFLVQQ